MIADKKWHCGAAGILLCLLLAACRKTEPAHQAYQSERQSAVFIYMVADNDLNAYAISNINQLEVFRQRYPHSGAIYVYIDPYKTNQPAHPLLYKITGDTTNLIHSEILNVYPETNSCGVPHFMTVLNTVMRHCRQQNQRLKGMVLWSHGSAWLPKTHLLISKRDVPDRIPTRSFGIDKAGNNNIPETYEMDIKALAQALQGLHFDFLLFDACFMGSVEVFYELKNSFDYIIASPAEVLAYGFPYDRIMSDLLAVSINYDNIAQAYLEHYANKTGLLQSAAVIVVRTHQLPQLAQAFKQLIQTQPHSTLSELKNILQYDFGNNNLVLFDIRQSVKKMFTASVLQKKVLNLLSELIVTYQHTNNFFNHYTLSGSSGISIYLPNNADQRKELHDYYQSLHWYGSAGFNDWAD